MRKWLPWAALVVVLVGALAVGTRDRSTPTLDGHVRRIGAQLRCPECQGQSVADSDSSSSEAMREEIRTRIGQGQSDQEIRDFFVSKFGQEILLEPPSSGASSLVWALPVMAFVAAAAGLVVAFRRWRRMQEAW